MKSIISILNYLSFFFVATAIPAVLFGEYSDPIHSFSITSGSQLNQTESCGELRPNCCCPNDPDPTKKKLLILIHGVDSTGTEFNQTENILKDTECLELQKFTYDDQICIEDITKKLKEFVTTARDKGDYCSVQILAHSAGGIMASNLAADPQVAPIEVHTAATPLNGGDYGFPAWLAQPFIGCLNAAIGVGLPAFKSPASGSVVIHHKTTDTDDRVLGKGYQTGNDVPNSTSVVHPGVCHLCILRHVAEHTLKPDCSGKTSTNCASPDSQK